jgi:hypothetical protein
LISLFFLKDTNIKLIEGDKNRKKHLVISILIFGVTYLFLTIFFIFRIFSKVESPILIGTEISMAVVLVVLLNKSLNRCFNLSIDEYKKNYKIFNFLLIVAYLIIGNYFSKQIHYIFTTPNNIVNIEQVKSSIALKFPNTEQDLIYYNDKYIFIKITQKVKLNNKGKVIKDSSEKIYITKFESLFNDEG